MDMIQKYPRSREVKQHFASMESISASHVSNLAARTQFKDRHLALKSNE